MLPEGVQAVVNKNSFPMPPIYDLLKEKGNLDETMMYNTYNMGLGMILVVDAADVSQTMDALTAAGEQAFEIGYVEAGTAGTIIR
jgi:phosphoribosylformylglycinamidine cyclo-ligase